MIRHRVGAVVAAGAVLALAVAACETDAEKGGERTPLGEESPSGGITVTWQVPDSLDSTPTLAEAAQFAWQQFFALNWPTVAQNGQPGNRETPDTTLAFGDTAYAGPLVWHTYRNKVEIFPGTGNPPGYTAGGAAQDFGYDALPQFNYATSYSAYPGTTAGTTPWINVDESSEIGEDGMFAGVVQVDSVGCSGQQVLFLAKANRTEYVYAARNNLWGADGAHADSLTTATAAYVAANRADPPAGSASASAPPDSLISLPNGTIELKSAWRALNPSEKASGRFYQQRVRYYCKTPAGQTAFVDDTLGLVALHIIHKTSNAPYFVYATFEQADNLLTVDGQPVEDSVGNLVANQSLAPTAPAITSQNATQPTGGSYQPSNLQVISPATSDSVPGKRLFYRNTVGDNVTQGPVALNRRTHSIPATIIQANQQAQAAMSAYFAQHGITNSPLRYYKLINVQYAPMTKTAGVDYTGPDVATFYQANSVVETDYVLQTFSGIFQPGVTGANANGLITDWLANGDTVSGDTVLGDTAFNVQYAGKSYLMGGCMGCHGNAQKGGTGFSFILTHPVHHAEPADSASYLTPQPRLHKPAPSTTRRAAPARAAPNRPAGTSRR
jgi:hypothetical protein